MIKQTWNISADERFRILQLHENATKKLYLLNEQDPPENPYGATPGGTPKTKVGEDDEYVYFLSQPNQSVGADRVDFNKTYYIFAVSKDLTAYLCEITEEDDSGRPKKVKVLTDRPIPDVRKNEFFFNFIREKKFFDYEPGNEITKKAFLGQGKDDYTGVSVNEYYYGVTWFDGTPMAIIIANEGPTYNWGYQRNNNEIYIRDLEIGSKTPFNPVYDVFVTDKGAKLGKVIPSLFNSYRMPQGFNKEKPEEEITKIVPNAPQPVPLGDKFADNISTPTAQAILSDPKFIEFKKFVEGNDVSKFVFDIKSSASKCTAGFKEANKANGKWKDDKSVYPDVTVDPDADKNDLGNLNLTKARAQNLKNFLIANLPQLKNAQFRVVAQGSKGTCGTEEENAKNRVVDLIVTKL